MGRTHFRGRGCRLYNYQDSFRFKRQKAQMPLAPAATVSRLCTRSVGRTGPRSQPCSSVPPPFFLEVVTQTQSHGKGRTLILQLCQEDGPAVLGCGWAGFPGTRSLIGGCGALCSEEKPKPRCPPKTEQWTLGKNLKDAWCDK